MYQPRRAARYYYLRLLRLKGDPHTLARGIAVGLFVGVTPTIPLHTALILAFAFLFRGNIIAGVLSSWLVSNPLTFLPQYYLSWKIGKWLTSTDLSWSRINEVMEILASDVGFKESLLAMSHLGKEAIATLLLGGCLLAAPITLAGYVLSFKFFLAVQRKRREKHILK